MKENKNRSDAVMADFDDLYNDAEHWLSNICFLADELRFLKKVMDNYLQDQEDDIRERLDQVGKELKALELEKQALSLGINKHLDTLRMKTISTTAEPAADTVLIHRRHQDLLQSYHALNKQTREFKDHLFSITDDVFGG